MPGKKPVDDPNGSHTNLTEIDNEFFKGNEENNSLSSDSDEIFSPSYNLFLEGLEKESTKNASQPSTDNKKRSCVIL